MNHKVIIPDREEDSKMLMNESDATTDGNFYAGVDVGSRTTKVVILNGYEIVSSTVLDTGINPKKAAEKTLDIARSSADVKNGQIRSVVGTGYGRVSLSFVDKTVTELSCHAKGCRFINPHVRTVVDIGGQDSKVVHLDENGNMLDFAMNDKCAAGTGKFLEVLANALEMDLETMGNLDNESVRPCVINSMCAVFAESEVISLLAKGEKVADIVAGINQAFSRRVGNMVKRLGIKPEVAFVGGVAKNKGLASALADFLQTPFVELNIDPQITGALGAAVLAKQLTE